MVHKIVRLIAAFIKKTKHTKVTRVRSETHMSLLDSLALDEGDFSRAFDSLHNMLICRTVGDCNAYDSFFAKQCSEQNPEALRIKSDILAMLANIDFVLRDGTLPRNWTGAFHGI
jgi:hypothetical protein